MIEMIGLSKRFGSNELFSNFNLKISDGEFVIFSGKSGCGKTTLLNMIGGIEPISDGKIKIDDFLITPHKSVGRAFFQKKAGFIFQNFGLVDNKTVFQNLAMIDKKCRTEISFKEAMQMVGIAQKAGEMVYKLSGGQQQRVALARLLIKQCDIVLADEPTGSLDWENARNVAEIIEKIHKMGKTVIMVTHDERLFSIAERVIHL